MTRGELAEYIRDFYGAKGELLWERYPGYAVFRHEDNKKWFAVILNVPAEKLGEPADGEIDIVNLKCDPIMVGSLRSERGIYPGYHMNKSNWISVALNSETDSERLKMLLDLSFEMTRKKITGRRKKEKDE